MESRPCAGSNRRPARSAPALPSDAATHTATGLYRVMLGASHAISNATSGKSVQRFGGLGAHRGCRSQRKVQEGHANPAGVVIPATVRVRALGHVAYRALQESDAVAWPVPSFEQSPYLIAAGEIIWMGRIGYPMHPRAVFVDAGDVSMQGPRRFDTAGLCPWQPWRAGKPAAALILGANMLCVRVAHMHASAAELGKPRGLGVALTGMTPPFPLSLGMRGLRTLVQAVAADDAEAAYRHAAPLLGFGPGLTPSGDDFIGAMLFARQLVSPLPAWSDVARRLTRDARECSHVISAALFGDLARGESFASLHALADALAGAGCEPAALAAAGRLARIGHSSGWDMLAGFLAGVTGALYLDDSDDLVGDTPVAGTDG